MCVGCLRATVTSGELPWLTHTTNCLARTLRHLVHVVAWKSAAAPTACSGLAAINKMKAETHVRTALASTGMPCHHIRTHQLPCTHGTWRHPMNVVAC